MEKFFIVVICIIGFAALACLDDSVMNEIKDIWALNNFTPIETDLVAVDWHQNLAYVFYE